MPRRKTKWSKSEAFENVTRAVHPDAQQPDRLEWERKMFRNLAYLSGIQQFSQDPISGRLHPVRDLKGRPRRDFTANLVLPTVTRAISKITNLNGAFTVAPASGERKDREGAKIGEKWFDYFRHSEDFKEKEQRALFWAANTGLGVLKFSWDPDAGDPERVYLMSEEEKMAAGYDQMSGPVAADPNLSDEALRQKDREGEYEDIPQGEISCQVQSPYGFYWDPDAKDGGLDACGWCATKGLFEVDKINERYGTKVQPNREIKADTWNSHNTLYEEAVAQFHGGQAAIGRTVPGRDRRQNARVTVIEYFERPNRSNGMKGRYVVIAGDEVVVNKANPYATIGHPLPFVTFGWIPRPGGFVSIDLTGNLTDPQRAYNESNQHMQDMERQQGYPILVTWKGAGIKSHKVPNYPGPVMELNPTFGPPVQIPPAPLPQYVYQNVENRRREMHEIASQGEASRGGAPGQVRGSQAISALLNEDNQILNLVAESHFRSLARCGRIVLALAGHFYDTRRTIKLLGAGSHWDVTSFMGADLRGNFDLRVNGEANRVDGTKMRQAVIMELVSAGFLNPGDPADKELVLDSLYLSLPDQPFEDMLIDKRNAEKENEKLVEVAQLLARVGPGAAPAMMSEMPIVRDFEDHRVHMEEHDKLRKSPEYEELPPQAQQLIDAHVAAHQKYAAVEMQQQLELQMLMTQNGGQPTKGKASQPKPGKTNL